MRSAGMVAALVLGVFAAPAPVAAQDDEGPLARSRPFLMINQERLLTDSLTGRALLADEARARDELRAAARAIDAAFETEERELTELRADLSPEEFREQADDFDARVVAARREQDARSAALVREFDLRRRQFYGSVAPLLVEVMDRYGALAILDEDSVLVADQSINITGVVIAEIDAAAAPDAEEGTSGDGAEEGGGE